MAEYPVARFHAFILRKSRPGGKYRRRTGCPDCLSIGWTRVAPIACQSGCRRHKRDLERGRGGWPRLLANRGAAGTRGISNEEETSCDFIAPTGDLSEPPERFSGSGNRGGRCRPLDGSINMAYILAGLGRRCPARLAHDTYSCGLHSSTFMNRLATLLQVLSLAMAASGCTARVHPKPGDAFVENLGGKVTVDKKSPGNPVISVDLKGARVTDAGLEHLKGLSQTPKARFVVHQDDRCRTGATRRVDQTPKARLAEHQGDRCRAGTPQTVEPTAKARLAEHRGERRRAGTPQTVEPTPKARLAEHHGERRRAGIPKRADQTPIAEPVWHPGDQCRVGTPRRVDPTAKARPGGHPGDRCRAGTP